MRGLSESPRLGSLASPRSCCRHSYHTQLRRNQSFGGRNRISAAPLVGSHGGRNTLLHRGFAVSVGSAEEQQYHLRPACFHHHDGAALLPLAHRYHKLLHLEFGLRSNSPGWGFWGYGFLPAGGVGGRVSTGSTELFELLPAKALEAVTRKLAM